MHARIATGIAPIGEVEHAAGVTLAAYRAGDRGPVPLPSVVRHRAGMLAHVGLMALYLLRVIGAVFESLSKDEDVLMRPQGSVVGREPAHRKGLVPDDLVAEPLAIRVDEVGGKGLLAKQDNHRSVLADALDLLPEAGQVDLGVPKEVGGAVGRIADDRVYALGR